MPIFFGARENSFSQNFENCLDIDWLFLEANLQETSAKIFAFLQTRVFQSVAPCPKNMHFWNCLLYGVRLYARKSYTPYVILARPMIVSRFSFSCIWCAQCYFSWLIASCQHFERIFLPVRRRFQHSFICQVNVSLLYMCMLSWKIEMFHSFSKRGCQRLGGGNSGGLLCKILHFSCLLFLFSCTELL